MADPAAPTPQQLRATYRRRAARYALTARLYTLGGFRYTAYRKQAIRRLALDSGDTVVELGCGTGENLQALVDAVGPTGHVIGVDLTDAMLRVAQERIDDHGWSTVSLIEADARSLPFEVDVDAVLASYALAFMPDTAHIVDCVADALVPTGRFVVLDYHRAPRRWPAPLRWLMRPLLRPFGATPAQDARDPLPHLRRRFDRVTREQRYFGMVYLDSATGPGRDASVSDAV